MPADSARRARLRAAQAEVVRALLAGGPPPAGFARRELAKARRVIEEKRGRTAAKRASAPPLARLRSKRRR